MSYEQLNLVSLGLTCDKHVFDFIYDSNLGKIMHYIYIGHVINLKEENVLIEDCHFGKITLT